MYVNMKTSNVTKIIYSLDKRYVIRKYPNYNKNKCLHSFSENM